MPQHFLDSSVLVKRYREEIGSRWMLELSRTSERLIVSRLTHVEVASALARRSRAYSAPSQQTDSLLAALNRDMRELFQIVEFSGPIILRAIDLVQNYGLRAADGIQLACALIVQADLAPSTEFHLVSADEELNAAALAEGLQIENPNLYL